MIAYPSNAGRIFSTLLIRLCLVLQVEAAEDYINMEGYLEKLPISKAKDTFLKTWKRRYFKAHNGTLHYYEVLALISKSSYIVKKSV